jgi:hypothetical protein
VKTFAGLLFVALTLVSAPNAFAACTTPPIAHADAYNMAKNTYIIIYFNDLTLNDYDPDVSAGMDSLSAFGIPATGVCGVAPNGFCYQPPANFTGLVSIPYTVTDQCGNNDGGDILIFVQ